MIPYRFTFSTGFVEGLAAVDENYGKTGFINRDGDYVIEPRFSGAGRFRAGICLVTIDDEIGYINRLGEFVWKGRYVENRLGLDLRF